MKFPVCVSLCLFLSGTVSAQDWYTKAVKSVDMKIVPAEAKPGQTVTVRITIDLNDPYHTYPIVQPDPKAADQVNSITLPEPNPMGLIFVGKIKDPANPEKKAEPLLGIKEMFLYPGTVTYEHKAVVSPQANGSIAVKIPKFMLLVCDDKNCFPSKKLSLEAKINVSGAAVEVEKEFADEVKKALAAKK